MRDCTGLHPIGKVEQRPTAKSGLAHLRAEYGPLAMRSQNENGKQLLS